MAKKWIFSAFAVATLAIAAPNAALAKNQQKRNPPVCKKIFKLEEEECAHIMCDDDIKAGEYKNIKECTEADGYGEAASEGCYGLLPKVVKAYNEEHGTRVFCDPELK